MLKAFSTALLGAGFVALMTVPAHAFEVGPVQVILQPRVIVAPEPHRTRVVVVEEPQCEPVVERRVIVIRKHGRHWGEREYYQGRDRDDCDRDDWKRDRWDRDDDPRFERTVQREVVVIRR